MQIQLGRLVTVPVRDVWTHEANDFTPWLATPENISLLAETLQIGEIEVEATEREVGRFSADIVCKDDTGAWVLIENQLEQTDHRHLGQVLTYLAGLDGDATIVWIATHFLEEHRAAIDWLNANTNDRFAFFGVEIQVMRIGQSVAAPQFAVVAKPNDWSRNVGAVSRKATTGEMAERHKYRAAYWASFSEYLRKAQAPFSIRRECTDYWFTFPIGRSGISIIASLSNKTGPGVEVYIDRDDTKSGIRALEKDRAAIEAEFGEPLSWQELAGKRASRIAIYLSDADATNSAEYERIHRWMLDRMIRYRNVFGPRVKTIVFGPADGEAERSTPLI